MAGAAPVARRARHAARRAARRLWHLVRPEPYRRARHELARRHLRGEGLELGALHRPIKLPRGARARYVDRYDVETLRAEYPELDGEQLVPVDVVDDGERLDTIPDGSVSFVVANHFVEHCEDPLGTLRTQLRVLRPGGIAFLTVPDKRRTFDRDRPETDFEHVLRDYQAGPDGGRRQHYAEWARELDAAPDADARAEELLRRRFSIHFHVWTPERFLELLVRARTELRFPFELREFRHSGVEFVAVLARTDEPLPPAPRSAPAPDRLSAGGGSPASA